MLKIEKVSKKTGHRYALDGFQMEVKPGVVYGLLGEPGAGKTTALKLACGLLRPDQGTVFVRGLDIRQRENLKSARRITGYMQEKQGLYPNLLVMEYMECFAHAYGQYGLKARERCRELLEMAGMEKRSEQLVETLSESMKRQLNLLKTLIHRPKLLLLDAPFLGMELAACQEAEEWIRFYASEEGATIVITSRTPEEIADFCHYLGLMHEGRMVTEGSIQEVTKKARTNAPILIRVFEGVDSAVRVLHSHDEVKSIAIDGNTIQIHFTGNEEEEAELLSWLISSGVAVRTFVRGKSSLEDLLDQNQKGGQT